MIELRLLGCVELCRRAAPADAPSVVAPLLRQPKRLALLAYLYLAGRHGPVRRDAVLALFWPELDETRARAALRQALHFLRQHLGDDVIETRGDALGVAAGGIHSDVVAFEQALAEERWADATTLYRGPLLGGLHAGAGPAFDEWLARERAPLHDGARQAVDEVGRAAEAAGNLPEAVRWARRAVELAPTHEPTTRRLMRLLADVGDPASALAAYEALATRLRDELDAGPSARTAGLAEEVWRSLGAPSGDGVAAGSPVRDAVAIDAVEPAETPTAAAPSSVPTTAHMRPPVPHVGGSGWRSRRGWLVALGALGVTIIMVGWSAQRGTNGAQRASQQPVRLAVLPFDVKGAGAEGYLLDGMTEAVAARLASIEALEVVDPQSTLRYRESRQQPQEIGIELDVPYVVRGTVQWTRGPDGTATARVTPVLVRTADGVIRWSGGPYALTSREPFAMQAEIARQVARALDVALTREERRTLARQPTNDADAYHQYLRGLDRLREWRSFQRRTELLSAAAESFARATEEDTTFALAYARLAEVRLHEYLASGRARARDPHDLQPFQSALHRARQLDPALPEAIAVHGQYLHRVVRDTARAYQAYDSASALRPNDAGLLVNRVRYPASKGSLDRDAALLERALQLDPAHVEALQRLVLLLGTARRYADADHFAARLTRADPQGFVGYLHGAKAALNARGDTLRAQRILEEGMRRSRAPLILLQEFHMLGDDFARALDTLDLQRLTSGRSNHADSINLFMVKLEVAQRLNRPAAVRAAADTLRQIAAREPAPQIEALRLLPVAAALGHAAEAHRLAGIMEEHSDAQMREMFAGGDTTEARRIQGAIAYTLARGYARTGHAPKMALHLGRALAAPNGVTAHYVRLDPAFRAWHDRPEFESVLARAPGPPPSASRP